MGGAAGDDVQLGALFGNDDVVHLLGQVLVGDVEAGLDRVDHLGSGQRPDEIPVLKIDLGVSRELVLVHAHRAPPIVLQPVVLLQRLRDGEHFDAFPAGGAVHHRPVHLDEGAGSLTGIIQRYAYLHELCLVLCGKL